MPETGSGLETRSPHLNPEHFDTTHIYVLPQPSLTMLICIYPLDPHHAEPWQGKKERAIPARIPCLAKSRVKPKAPLTFRVILECRSSICMGTTTGISSSSKKGPRPLSTEVNSSRSQPWSKKCRKPFCMARGEWTAAPGPTSKRMPTAGLMWSVLKAEDSWKLVPLRREAERKH